MIDGVLVKVLTAHCDERGRLMEILRTDDAAFEKFGQVYMTTAYPGVVKAWHTHQKQADFFCCVSGMIKLVLYDARPNSPTRGEINEFVMGEHHPIAVRIPREVWHGFKCIGTAEAMVINTVTQAYSTESPDELRRPPHGSEIPFDWAAKDG